MSEAITTSANYDPWPTPWRRTKVGALAVLFASTAACGNTKSDPVILDPISIDCQQNPGKSVSLTADTTKVEQRDIGDAVIENGRPKWRDVLTVYTAGDHTVSPVAQGFGPVLTYAQIEASSKDGSVGPITDTKTGSRLDMGLANPPDGKTVVLTFTCGPKGWVPPSTEPT